jgi:proline dehydrogenase
LKLLYPFAKRFIAGQTLEDASRQVLNLHNLGFKIALNLVGESAKNQEEIKIAQKQYLKALKLFSTRNVSLSIKPSLLGLNNSKEDCLEYLTPIVEQAKLSEQTIRFDMEDSTTTDSTIELCQRLNQRVPNVIGVALQANLYRTEDDLKSLKSEDISVRLVKGAYKENKVIAFMHMRDIRENFLKLAHLLSNYKGNEDAVATHDEILLDSLIESDRYQNIQFEFLFGVRRDLQQKFNKKHSVGIYLPYGKNWLPYTIRRLSEWKNIKFIAKNLIKEKL